ncbi:MAG: DUF1223 domain-containing protein [Bacteroidota bacterium]|nr:DUF1223 domain-containing protein [Bacteroidota bacterium]
MKSTSLFFIAGSIALAGLSFSFCNGKATKKTTTTPMGNGFAVVELFTSEGCSSCPPADEAMIRLAKEFPEHVYFLGYHVDYWDYLGWKDEFSNADYTERQQKYSKVFGSDNIYTPQAIVNGEKELVGSREGELKSIIQQDLKNTASSPANPVVIGLTAKKTAGENISVSYKVTNAGKVSLDIALVQLMATSNVKRGENEGHTLNHINIVRGFKTIPVNKESNGTVDIKIPAGLAAKDLKVIAFVQDERYLKIAGAAEAIIN